MPLGQSTYAIPAHYREDQFTVDIDQILNDKNTLSGRFFYSRAPSTLPFSPNGAANVPGWGTNELNRNTMFVLADTHVFNSNLVNIARFGYMRFDGLSTVQNPLTAQQRSDKARRRARSGQRRTLRRLTVGGLTIGDAGTPSQWQVTNSFIWQDTVALTKGRHNMRFGAEFKRHEVDVESAQRDRWIAADRRASTTFCWGRARRRTAARGVQQCRHEHCGRQASSAGMSGTQTSRLRAGRHQADAAADRECGSALRDLRRADGNQRAGWRTSTPIIAVQGRFRPRDRSAASPCLRIFRARYLRAWYRIRIRDLCKTPYGDVSPRLGFVWQMTEKPVLVLRGGYGIYFDRHSGNLAESGLSQPPFRHCKLSCGSRQRAGHLASPFVPLVLPNSSYPIFMPRTPTSHSVHRREPTRT